MKRFLAIMIATAFLLTLMPSVLAAEEHTLNFNLTASEDGSKIGKNTIYVKPQDTITVVYSLESSLDKPYSINSVSNVITYDTNFLSGNTFFEYVDGSLNSTRNTSFWHNKASGQYVISVNDYYVEPEEYEAKQIVASFKLKIAAESGEDYVRSINYSADGENGEYEKTVSDLKVIIGDEPSSGGGSTGGGSTGGGSTGGGSTGGGSTGGGSTGGGSTGGDTDTGNTDSGSDSGSGNSSGSSSGGGGSVTRYTLSFETNGGSKVNNVSKVRNTTVDLSKYITEKPGYSFDGWYTEKEFKNKVSSVKMTSNLKLFAKWVEGDNGYESNPNYKPDIFTTEHNAYIVGRDGGYIAPDENLTRAEAATMFFRLIDGQVLIEGMTKQNGFSDVNEGDWFNTPVSTLTNLGVLTGRDEDTFAPNALITRAEFMTIVARLSEAEYAGEDLFVDIAGHWARDYINIAASIKWANGYGVIFKPDSNITRAEAFTIVNRATNRLPENTSDLLDGMQIFVDNSDVNAWYYINIQEATNSHNFEMKADGVHEKWTSLKENPNWEEIEG